MKTNILTRDMFYGASTGTIRAASILRKNTTLAEKILWKRLRNRKLFLVKFRRQHPLDIFIVDFYCHEIKLVIEIDGEIHNSEEVKDYDLSRQSHIEQLGLTFIRFTNHEVIFEIDSVLTVIHHNVSKLTPLQGGRGSKRLVIRLFKGAGGLKILVTRNIEYRGSGPNRMVARYVF